jgi:hypothetical protein
METVMKSTAIISGRAPRERRAAGGALSAALQTILVAYRYLMAIAQNIWIIT